MDVRLVYFSANGRRREVHLHNGVVSLGRADTCQLRIPAETVSRRHCQIEVSPNEVVLTDLGSSNGTLVNGQKVSDDDVNLKPGDRITVGPATFIVQIDGKPADIGAPQPAAEADEEIEEALTGSSVADDSFDPFSALEELAESEDEEDEDEIPPQPRMAQIKRPEPTRKGPDKPGPKQT